MFGEGVGGQIQGTYRRPSGATLDVGQRNFAWSWMGIGAVPVKFGLAPNGGANPASDGANLPGDWNYFSSQHTGGIVLFAMGDGSVRGTAARQHRGPQPGRQHRLVGPPGYGWEVRRRGDQLVLTVELTPRISRPRGLI